MERYNIVDDLLALKVPIDDVLLDPNNANEGHDFERIGNSLKIYGQRKPIVVNKNTGYIEAGNGTWQSARNNEWTHIAVVWVDDDPDTAIGYSIADNRLAEYSNWNTQKLSELLSELDVEEMETGFDESSVELLMSAVQQNEDISFGSELMGEFVHGVEDVKDEEGTEFSPIVLEETYQLTLVFAKFEQRKQVELFLRNAKEKYDTNSSAEALYLASLEAE